MQTQKTFLLFHRYTLFLASLILFNILFGPLVRATDSGLACPDWPLCYGKFVPEYTFQIAMEVGHRYYSGILGLLILGATIWAGKNLELRKRVFGLSLVSLFFLATQVTLGGLTVLKLLDPTTVNLHLLNAILLLILVTTTSLVSNEIATAYKEKTPIAESLPPLGNFFEQKTNWLFVFTALLIAYQLFMGGRVSSHYAGLACPDFPTCHGEWFPEWTGAVKLQMEHRITGYLAFFFVLVSTVVSISKSKHKGVKFLWKVCLYLLTFQIFLGAVNVLYGIPKALTAFHSFNGVLVFLSAYLANFFEYLHQEKK